MPATRRVDVSVSLVCCASDDGHDERQTSYRFPFEARGNQTTVGNTAQDSMTTLPWVHLCGTADKKKSRKYVTARTFFDHLRQPSLLGKDTGPERGVVGARDTPSVL